MAQNVLGGLFSSLSNKAHDRAKEEQEKQDKSRAEEIGIWKTVLENPASSEEQRNKAVENLNKLYNWKGKGDSPFQRLAGFMKHVGNSLQARQAQAAVNTGEKPDTGTAPGERQQGPPNTGQAAPKPETSDIGQGKTNVAKKVLGKAASGLGGALGVVADTLNPHPKELPPLNAKDMPSPDQIEKKKLDDMQKEGELKNKFALEQIRARGEEAQKTAQVRANHAFQSKVKIPGNAITNAFGAGAQMVDADSLPIDPNGIYAPTEAEEGEGIKVDDDTGDGRRKVNVKRVGTGPAREGTFDTWMMDYGQDPPRLVAAPTGRKTGPPEPPKADIKKKPESSLPPTLQTRPKPGEAKPAGGKEKSPITGAPSGTDTKGKYASPFRSLPVGVVRTQQANQLQKLATSTDEARNSLIGDDPAVTAGLYADLDIFKDRESIARIRNYLGFIEKNIGGTSVGAGSGFVNGIEWLAGLPQAINELQQRGLQQFADKLKPAEQRFVTDYFRVMGTIGGMRASTGAPAARWSFITLFNELPTPGPVTEYGDAQTRIKNLVQETNVVAKRNPLSKKIDVNRLGKDQDPYADLSPEARRILEDRNIIPKKKPSPATK